MTDTKDKAIDTILTAGTGLASKWPTVLLALVVSLSAIGVLGYICDRLVNVIAGCVGA